MKKKRLALIGVVVLIFTVAGFFLLQGKLLKGKEEYIDKVLRKPAYSYLPAEAKDYIKEVYSQTGEIILTEKNKKDNTPYLNPKYVNYLSFSDNVKQNVEVIPDTYVTDFSSANNTSNDTYPSTYNLSNIDNKNYLTPFNDQGRLGLCWVFASVEQAESYLLVKKNQGYSNSSERFSIRQIDYATSIDGINNYENENAYRQLTTGGNFYTASLIMSYGLAFTDYTEYNQNTAKKELIDVLNYKNANYELNSSIMVPQISRYASVEEKAAYNNLIKENIVKNGGAYIGTGSPTGDCGFKNTDGTYAIVDADNCIGSSGHALQIIGWDDNYEYSYCQSGTEHLSVDSTGTCETGKLVSGKGAWILRNSWGEDSKYKYVYFGYSSYNYDVDFITSLTSMNERKWDNNYHKNLWKDGTVNRETDAVGFNKKIDTSEKLEQVKFMAASSSGKYTVSIETGTNTYTNIKEFDVQYPGIYTIDLSDKNIELDSSQFKITISSTNNAYIVTNTISAYTSNIDSQSAIKTNDISNELASTNNSGDYEYIVYSSTKNIASNELVTYSLYKDGIDNSNYIVSYKNNGVAENNVNATLTLSKDIPAGNYKLRTHYGNYYSESNITIDSIYNLQGQGTSDDPYQIYNEDDLNQMRYHLDAYYLLKNDITLTKDWSPIGTSGKPFRGGFDGGNHTITGLKINEKSDDAKGLFGYVEVKYDYDMQTPIYLDYREKTYIKNLKIKDANISNTGTAGILIGELTYDTNNPPPTAFNIHSPVLTIDSVHFIDGTVTSTEKDAGVLVGNINIIPRAYNTPYLNVNNMYSSATIIGNHSAGIIGYINDYFESAIGISLKITMTNFQNVGKINTLPGFETENNNRRSAVVGSIYGTARLDLSNYIINSTSNDYNIWHYLFDDSYFIGYYEKTHNFTYNLSNGYYISKANPNKNKTITSSSNLKDRSLYDDWTDFDKYWKIEEVDGITRIPVLKDINFNYTNVSEINIERYDEKSLLDYIDGENGLYYVNYETVSNDKVIDIGYKDDGRFDTDIIITALNKGTATIHIVNDYDGFEKDININVIAKKVEKPIITYYYNTKNKNNETYTQQVNALESFELMENKFTRPGYEFIGWNTSSDGTGTSYANMASIKEGIDENIRLYAQWEAINYTLRFNANGGAGTMDDQNIKVDDYSSGFLIPTNKYTRTNYSFIGWNTKADGSGVSIENKGILSYEQLINNATNNVTILYAQWSPIKYTITFNATGGKGIMNKQTISYGEETALNKNTFTKTGYTFKEWNTKADGTGTSYKDGGKITITENITLYAIWEETFSYEITGYEQDEENKYISSIKAGTTLADFTSHIKLNDNYTIKVDTKQVDDKELLYTGGKTKIYKNNELYAEYTNVVIGDVNGNAIIDIIDYIRIMKDIMEIQKLSGPYLKAADVNQNGSIDIIDYIRIMKMIMEEN